MLLKNEFSLIENSYYEASVRRPPLQAPLVGPVQADVCVIGAGYAGLSAALELAQRGFAVVLLEAQRVGWGASGRNGGQVITGYGSDGECAIERQFSRDDARRAWDITVEAVGLLRERIARHGIACDFRPGYLSLSTAARKSVALRRWMEHVQQAYGHPLEWIGPERIGDWVASQRFHSGVHDAASGHFHPLKYCLGLARAAVAAGVRLHENSPAYAIERSARPVVRTAFGSCSCDFIVLAGNVYMGEYGDDVAPEVASRIIPVGTYMVATEPMAASRADALMKDRPAASDTNFILDYFRLSADHRLLFGGADSMTGVAPRNLVERMRRSMVRVFPQLGDLAVTHAWGGFVDITLNKAPDFGRLGRNVYYVQGFSGHGVALAGMAGRLVADAIQGQAERFDLLARIRHTRLPLPNALRTPALTLAMWYYRLRDLW